MIIKSKTVNKNSKYNIIYAYFLFDTELTY